jgi:hypothetical protein
MAKNRTVLRSNFKAAEAAGDDAIAELIQKGTERMHEVAAGRLDKAAGQRGYNLYSTDLDMHIGDDDGRIEYKPFYGKFFEYGTVHIQAMPFIRPGYRAGRKLVKEDAPEVFVKWFNRKARVR